MKLRTLVFGLVTCAALPVFAGCEQEAADAERISAGTATLPLTAVGPEGEEYRLDSALFAISGTSSAALQSGGEVILSQSLPVGDYQVSLLPGWQLMKTVDGVATPVAATLVSANPQSFAIAEDATTRVTYRFEVDGTVIDLGRTGTAEIGIEVVEAAEDDADYFESGSWHGYVWTAMNGSGTTLDYSSAEGAAPFCAAGSVAASPDYDGFVMLGVNLNQAQAAGATPGTVTPTSYGLHLNVVNPGSSPLRVNLQGAAGQMWCAPLPAGDQVIAWSSFRTECWGNTGTPYNREAIESVGIIVPGSAATATPFDFCVNALAEEATIPQSGTLSTQYATALVTSNGVQYRVENNRWSAAGSLVTAYSGATFTLQQSTLASTTAPGAMPGLAVGRMVGVPNTTGINLPRQVSAITAIPTSWTHNAGTPTGLYSTDYELWFDTTSTATGGEPTGAYVAVWLQRTTSVQPIGNPVGNVTIGGLSYQVWQGQLQTRNYITFLSSTNSTSVQFDLRPFITETVNRGLVQQSWYLSRVWAGFEIWSGGTGLATQSYSISVQ